MDVAASHLSTKQMGPTGPTSEKAAKQMKNAAIFVAKRTKNWHGKHVSPKSRSSVSFPFFSLRLVFFFNRHAIETATETQNSKHKVKKKKHTHNLAEKITSVLRLDF